MARPNLSSLFSKFLFRETLTSQDKTDIRSDIGAEESGAAAAALVTAGADATTKANAAQAAALAASQPLAAVLTSYVAAASSAARRALIGAVGTAAEITSALQGVEADATKIGAEYMPDVIPVDGITLADSSSVELPVGTLGLRGDRLVIHDADTTGGYDADGLILRGVATLTVSDSIAADQLLAVSECIIPATLLTAGQYLQITGKFAVHNNLSNYNPTASPYLVFYFADASGVTNATWDIGDGYKVSLSTIEAATPAVSTLDMNAMVSASVSGGLLAFNLITGITPNKLTHYNGTTTVESLVAIATSGLTGERNIAYGGTGQFCYLRCALYLPADAATANTTGGITACSDLRIVL